MRKFKSDAPPARLDQRGLEILTDIRELLFMMLNAQIAGPDPAGNLTKLHERLERFVEKRMVEDDRELRSQEPAS